ncbi:hypothetical protein SDC9_96704 [bioreactor metagenome]|uniref:Peptidoglycan binding-like domain-containing protein n=1 Tax=bioreactor metagenome TaxID=1076179 RepID=A0A645A9U3_9ZZZZ
MANYTNLSSGSSGDEVKKLQELLQASGYSINIDGTYGKSTEDAVKDYQTKNSLESNGIADAALQAALYGDNDVSNWTTDRWLTEYEDNKPKYEQSQAVTDAANTLAQYEANKPGAYTSQYSDQIQSLLDQILNRDKFSYDFNADPLYQQYSQQYQRSGQMAMMDTMGQAANLTGGYGNSYAQTVGQQAYQQNMQGLNDILPELQSAAYSAYDAEGNRMNENLGTLQGLDDSDYSRYQNDVDQYYQDLSYYYNKHNDMSESEYNRYLNDLSSWEKDRAYWYSKQQDESALALAAAKTAGGSGSGSGGPRPASASKAYDAVLKNARLMSESDAKSYLERMVNGGYITADEAAYAYQVELGRTSGTSSVPKTYQEYVSATGNAGILSSSEFTARKKAGASGLSQYSSYQDYLAQKYTSTKK